MNTRQIVKYFIENGLLVDREVLDLFSETQDLESAKILVEKIKQHTQKKFITLQHFEQNKEKVSEFFLDLPEKKQKSLEKFKIKLGLSIEISKVSERNQNIDIERKKIPIQDKKTKQKTDLKKSEINENQKDSEIENTQKKKEVKNDSEEKSLEELRKIKHQNLNVKILSKTINSGEKKEVKDFLQHFRNRFTTMKNILQNRAELKNLVSINKITNNRQKISIIGLVSDKRITKNKNILFEVEDLTGKIKVLINQNKEEVYKKAEDISLDAVVGFTGSGNREIIFVNDVVFPDARLLQRKKSPEEEYVLFLGDIQIGSKIFMEKNFLKFIDYLNGNYKLKNAPSPEKIKYIFLVGDVVDGVGVFPKQEQELLIKDLEGQYAKLAEYLKKIRDDITIIISPGNHDGVRLMEPQPVFDEKYAWPIYNLKNVILTGNPNFVNIASKNNFPGFNVLVYHGYSYPYYADNVPGLMESGDALNKPEKIMKYLLKHRHLAPAHGSTQYYPLKEDGMLIKNVPDIFVSGHTHKMAVTYYNNILIISTATWEEQNKYQERMGNKPDFCKIPAVNLKTRQVKILDFEKIPEHKKFEKEQKRLELKPMQN